MRNDLHRNWVESGFIAAKTYCKPKRNPKVTIAIGLIEREKSKDKRSRIVFASDTQLTDGAAKRINTNKISIINFSDAQIMVAMADSVEAGDRTVELMRRVAKDASLDSPESGIKTAQAALREVRNHLKDWYKEGGIDDERLFWTEYPLNLLVGYYFESKPYLWSIGIRNGLYSPVNSFEAIGGGKDFAYALLKDYSFADPDFEYGFVAAVSIIDKTIDYIDGCNRPIRAGHVWETSNDVLTRLKEIKARPPIYKCHANIAEQSEIQLVVNEFKTQEGKFKNKQKEQMLAIVKKVREKQERTERKALKEIPKIWKRAGLTHHLVTGEPL